MTTRSPVGGDSLVGLWHALRSRRPAPVALLSFFSMLDVTMETASRQVSALKREGVLTLVGGRSARVHLQVLQQCLQAEDRA